jgi:hypothetical protein
MSTDLAAQRGEPDRYPADFGLNLAPDERLLLLV